MLFRRVLGPILLAVSAIAIGGGSTLAAQLSTGGTSLLVPITGVADLGGTFGGTMLIEQFALEANGVAAIGTVTGVLMVNGTVRNLVMQVTLPLDIAASRARANTDAALAQAPCDVLHVELDGASVNVLGTTIGLTPVAFDIASAIQAGSAPAGVSTAALSGTVTASPSTNTTQPANTSSTPGFATAPTTPQAAAQMPLGSLLCSVDRFRDVSSPAQLAQQLNAILTALRTSQG